jgi:pyruvate,water dikinase
MILPLGSSDATLARAGGKGANLASLVGAEFVVPPGFIVTTDAYRAFLASNSLEIRLLEMARSVSPDDPNALETASSEIRTLFSDGTMPPEIAEAVRSAYSELALKGEGDPPVAVRSSATAEDLPGLSFAGQQDTYLNVVGSDAVVAAVKSCWGSLWTARAMGYRARNNISPDEVALAAVVQEMIPSEVSGVLFTANPLTGHRGETVIDASFGLGEAIVSGQVEPDHYVVNQREMRIVSRKLGAKALSIMPLPEGGTEHITQERSQTQALADEQILDLTRTSEGVAEHFASPQDIEWAWASGRLYILQSRPITSLYPVPESLLLSEELRVLFSLNSLQGVIEPITPLGQGIFPLLATGILRVAGVQRPGKDILIVAGGRIFADFTIPITDRRLRHLILTLMANADPGARKVALGLIDSGRIPTSERVSRRTILRLIFGLRPVLFGIPKTWLRPEARRKRAIEKAERFCAQVQRDLYGANLLDERLTLLDRYLPHVAPKLIFHSIAPVMVPGLVAMGIVDRWLTAWAGAEPGAVRRLLRGLPGNPTTEMDLRLWAEAKAIQSDDASRTVFQSQPADVIATAYQRGELPATAQTALESFLKTYGMRAVGEIDIGRPRWRDDPRSIIQTLSSFQQIHDPDLAPDHVFQQAAVEAEKLAAEYVSQVRQRKGALRARMLSFMIRRMRLLVGMREVPKFYMIRVFDIFRSALLVSGHDLATEGKLERGEDIFFVPLDTLRVVAKGEPVDLKAVVARERQDYERELARRQIPRLLLSTGEVFYEGISESGTNDLVGEGVSPGMVEGKVRVVLDPRGVRLEYGEILVCPATDPGWTPLFLSAGGLVMELGGMITHGSVVAREYGIPAVVGVHEATKRLQNGQIVRVDGSAGRILVLG